MTTSGSVFHRYPETVTTEVSETTEENANDEVYF